MRRKGSISTTSDLTPLRRTKAPEELAVPATAHALKAAGGRTVMKVDEWHDDEETDRQAAIPSYLNSVSMPVIMW